VARRAPYQWKYALTQVTGPRKHTAYIATGNNLSVTDSSQFPLQIPFSKFFLSNSGRVQDKQAPIILDRVKYLSLTLSDDAHGPFSLEIDYIGLMYDAYDRHEFFYEMYDGDPLMS